MSFQIERLRGPESFADLISEWECLHAQITPRTLFASPLWIGLWWRRLRRQGPLLHDEFFCHTVRDASGHLLAVAPLMITRCPGVGPLQMRIVQFFGADSGITELRGVICRPEHQEMVIQALVA